MQVGRHVVGGAGARRGGDAETAAGGDSAERRHVQAPSAAADGHRLPDCYLTDWKHSYS